jgi:hypothetical protein
VTVILDKAWADLLGVQREHGLYRISRRELMARLAKLRNAEGDVRAPAAAPPVAPFGCRHVVALPLDPGVHDRICANGG